MSTISLVGSRQNVSVTTAVVQDGTTAQTSNRSFSIQMQQLSTPVTQTNAASQVAGAGNDETEDDAKYLAPQMQPGVLYNVDKWIDTHMSAQDKTAIGFPFSHSVDANTATGLRMLAESILEKRQLGYLRGKLTAQYLTDQGPYGLGDIRTWPDFQTADGQEAVTKLLKRCA